MIKHLRGAMLPGLLMATVCAQADLTVKGSSYEVSESGERGRAESYTIYLKGDQMRVDNADSTTMLVRPGSDSAPEMVLLDHGERTAMVMPRAAAQAAEAAISASGDTGTVRVVGDGGESILGYDVVEVSFGYEGEASLAEMGGQEIPPEMADMMSMSLRVSGTALVSPDAPGANELISFYLRTGMGGLAGVLPGSSITEGLTDVMTRVSDHGFPLRTTTTSEVVIEIDAPGPVATMLRNMLSAMPNMKSTSIAEVTEISSDAVDDALFFGGGLPEGYRRQ